jgi:DNA-3-methyladenine glycosylase II
MWPAAFERTNTTDPTTAASPATPGPINQANGTGHHFLQTRGAGTPLRVTAGGVDILEKESVSAPPQTDSVTTTTQLTTTQLDISGPFDLRELAMMGFGHRDERSFDGVMRMAFCLDGDYERQVGAEAEQFGNRLEVRVQAMGDPLSDAEVQALGKQVARVLSLDHDGEAFHRLCLADPVLARVHNRAPGFRPALFYSPYEAALWSIISARRARSQGIALRARMSEMYGADFELSGIRSLCVPTPSALLEMGSVPGLPADRLPRLRAVAEAAQRGELNAERLRSMPPEEAQVELQQLPGIGPFYSSLIVIRACGHADAPSLGEARSRGAIQHAYGIDHELSDTELLALADTWRPFRTWVSVMMRAA